MSWKRAFLYIATTTILALVVSGIISTPHVPGEAPVAGGIFLDRPAPPSVEGEEYLIYRTVIRKWLVPWEAAGQLGDGSLVAVLGQTDLSESHRGMTMTGVKRLYDALPAVSFETCFDYFHRNALAYPLSDDFDPGAGAVLLSPSELTGLLPRGEGGDGWKAFHQARPELAGMLMFSRIGFDDERREALVSFWYWHGPGRATGEIDYLRNKQSGWTIRARYRLADSQWRRFGSIPRLPAGGQAVSR